MKNIILYGMRGTGKSTIGKELAEKLNYNFIDLDKYISEKNNIKLSDFIEKKGWDIFRNEENKCLKKVLKIKGRKIISLGGGTIIYERNRKELFKDKNTKIIYLNTSLENISNRILKDEKYGNSRNSLTGKSVLEELSKVFEERKNIYKNNCDFEIDNNGIIEDSILEIERKINYGGICIPVISQKNIYKFYDEIKNDRKIEFIELRLDLIFKNEKLIIHNTLGDSFNTKGSIKILGNIIKKCPKKIICTNRASFEGGNFEGTSEESLDILKKCLDFGADYIDIELESLNSISRNKKLIFSTLENKKLIISHHNFKKTPNLEYLKNILKKMEKYNPEVYKIAVMPNSEKDVDVIFDLNNYFKDSNKIFISMGELGKNTRIILPKYFNLLSFGIFGKKGSAPGQIIYKELHKKIFEEKEVLFLGGPQISGSFSPFMHNYSSNKLEKEENKFRYKLEKISIYSKNDAEYFIKKLESDKKYLGANITMPYKIDVYNYLLKFNRLEKNAQLVGAVNTLFKKNGKIYGTNTDLEGISGPILNKISLLKDVFKSLEYSVYILGAGGASRAAIGAMIELKVKNIFVLNRSQKSLDVIEKHFKKYLGENQKIITKIYDVKKGDVFPKIYGKNIIINTLPFGFKKDLPKSPIKFKELEYIKNNLELYFEAVYDSKKGDTPIVEEIINNYTDIKICRGIEMLIGQAKTGFELWSKSGEFKSKEITDILLKK